MTQSSALSRLPLTLSSGASYEEQIVEQIPEMIRTRALEPGGELPPATQLASELLVSPGTVRRAYRRLEADGLVVRRPGHGPAVVRDADDVLYQQTLDRSRSELSRAIAEVRRLAPTGREELEIEAEHLRRAIEVDQARKMQRSLLPRTPPAIEGLEIAVSMSTASEVGGDYYDFLERPDGGLRAVIGDATGHGLAAGIMAAMTKSCLAAISAESPAGMMRKANDVLRAVRGTRVMMALGMLDIEGSRATICSAGMPPIFVVRAQTRSVEEIALPSLPLGSALVDRFPCTRIRIGRGDALVAVSDGLTELRDPHGEALGWEPIRACLAGTSAATAQETVAELTRLASAWAEKRPLEDDLTILVIKRRGGGEP